MAYPQPIGPGLPASPMMFGAGAQGAVDPTQAAILALIQQMGGGVANGMDMAALMTAMNQPTEQIRRGMGGGVINAENPQGHAGGDPFTNGFFGAKPGTPEFSGRTTPLDMMAASKAPAVGDQTARFQAGAVAASPAPFMPQQGNLSFLPPAPLTGPLGSPQDDQAALAANLAMMQPGGMAGFWSELGAKKKKPAPTPFRASAMPGFGFGAGAR